jgi:hypothetical protein
MIWACQFPKIDNLTFSDVFLPKYLLLLLSSILIYDFHATFDRRLTLRQFCSPQCKLSSYCALDGHCSHRHDIIILWFYAPPNEDFGRMNKRWNQDFRSTFQRLVAQIEYSRPWKVLRKSWFHLLFLLPKSSFGMDRFRHAYRHSITMRCRPTHAPLTWLARTLL